MSQTTAKRLILIIFAMLLLPAVVMAAIDSWTATGEDAQGNPVDLFRVELYEIDETSNPPAVTYKYAVTDLYSGGGALGNGLSHWTLGIEQCANVLVSPEPGPYTTPVDPAVCGAGLDYPSCVAANYQVSLGADPTTGVTGIKFDGNTLTYPQTHLFHITVAGETDRGEIPVAVKPGNTFYEGTITGPICKETAVSFSNTSVASSGNTAFVAIGALTVLMGVATVGVWRKHEK